MPSFVANNITFQPLSTISTGGINSIYGGPYYDDSRTYGPPPAFGPASFEDEPITYPGVDGVAFVRKGFRGRPIYATLIWAGSLYSVSSSMQGDMDNLTQLNRYQVTLPGGLALTNCRFVNGGQPTWVNMNNGCLCIIKCQWSQFGGESY
jgi:hypothetical protein